MYIFNNRKPACNKTSLTQLSDLFFFINLFIQMINIFRPKVERGVAGRATRFRSKLKWRHTKVATSPRISQLPNNQIWRQSKKTRKRRKSTSTRSIRTECDVIMNFFGALLIIFLTFTFVVSHSLSISFWLGIVHSNLKSRLFYID